MDLRLHAAEEPVNFSRSEIDVAIRYGRGDFPGLKGGELFQDEFAPVASPRLRLREAAHLHRQRLIPFLGFRVGPRAPSWPRWREQACIILSPRQSSPSPTSRMRSRPLSPAKAWPS